ncbi:unnamed protein product [Calypogeia fissa]
MTQDDECSVYVGGLAYDSTEDMLQKSFETYGDINSIKAFTCSTPSTSPDIKPNVIVYDRESGQSRGFGFVTFTNPRAASKAINGLDGGVLGGRTIRVNEVKKNSGKTLNRDGSFRDRGEKDRRESRDRDRSGRGRNFSPLRNRRSSPVSRRSNRGRSPPSSPGPGRSARTRSPGTSPIPGRTPGHRRSRSPRAGRSPSFNSSSAGRPRAHSSRTSQSPQSSDRVRNLEESTHRTSALSSRIAKREQTDVIKVREELDRAVQSRQELEDKVSSLTSAVDQAKETVAALQTQSQKLEETLASAQATVSHRQQQLKKLQKGILQVQESSERLKSHEKELKVLMLATMKELEVIDMDTEDHLGTVGNGGLFDGDKIVEVP